jgi:hypothetical protein
VRYDRGVIESFVDLTYRGLSLGRRVRLSQVRPSAGYLELPAPMPVGSEIAIAAEDGTAFDAVVTGVHEQVAGSDRTPGMIVAPALAAEAAAAWWAARVSLPDDDALRPRATGPGRSRPATVRPRSHTTPTPPPLQGETIEATTDEVPTIIADLDARVAAAAGLAPARPDGDRRLDGDRSAMRTMVMPLSEIEALTAASADPEPDPVVASADDHAVLDDGKRTVIMQPLDPVALGLAAPGLDAGASGDGGPEPDTDDDEPPDTLQDAPTAQPARGPRRRRSRR